MKHSHFIRYRCVLTAVAFLAAGAAGRAAAITVTVPLSDFVIFSNNGTTLGGHSLVNGAIGSNQDFSITGPAQINGPVYVGGDFTLGSNSAVGSDGSTLGPDLESSTRFVSPAVYPALLAEVVVNGGATIGGNSVIYGNLHAFDIHLSTNATIKKVSGVGGNVDYTGTYSEPSTLPNPAYAGTSSTPSAKTFGTIAMTPGIAFTATGANQQVNSTLDFLQLAPGPSNTYGALSTSQQGQTVRLSSGDYFFSSISAQGGFTLEIDLSSGQPININVVGNATFAQDTLLKVKGAGTGGLFVPISQAPDLAGLINWNLGGRFDLGGGDNNAWTTIFGGKVLSLYNGSGDGIVVDQHVDWYGELYAYDTIHLADHSRFNYVPPPAGPNVPGGGIPEPLTAATGALALAGLMLASRRREARSK